MKKLILAALFIGMVGAAKSQEVIWNYGIESTYLYGQPSTDYVSRPLVFFTDTTSFTFNVDTVAFGDVKFTKNDVASWKAAYTAGNATFSGLTSTSVYTITHGLGYTPTSIFLQPRNYDAAQRHYFINNITATTFDIVFLVAPAVGTNNIIFDLIAIR